MTLAPPRLAKLKDEHARLDDEINHEQARPLPDNVRLQALKRHKLRIKEAMLPDGTDPARGHAWIDWHAGGAARSKY
jgi:hypothetical protein